MSPPRFIVDGQTLRSEKMLLDGRARLRPDPFVVQTVLYTMAVYSAKHGIELHEFCVTANREYIQLTDPGSTRSEFYKDMRSQIARAVNRYFGERDVVYSRKQHREPRSLDTETALEDCLQTLLEPVRCEYVRYAKDWPSSSWKLEYDKPIKIRRPPVYFTGSHWPDEVTLVIKRPPGLREDLDARALRAWIREKAQEEQRELIVETKDSGRSFLGMKRVCKMNRHARPDDGDPRLPECVARGKCEKEQKAAQEHYLEFVKEHGESRRRWRDGKHDCKFPHGTYLVRRLYGLPCHGPSP